MIRSVCRRLCPGKIIYMAASGGDLTEEEITTNARAEERDLTEEEITANARAEERYFASKKAGLKPAVEAADQEELVSFVEDGLNRGKRAKPKPALGSRRLRDKPAKKNHDLISRKLCTLKNAMPLPSTSMQGVFDNAVVVTEILVFAGLSDGLSVLACANKATCLATREPVWQRLAQAVAWDHGLLAVELQHEHPAAPRCGDGQAESVDEAWKARFWTLFQARHTKWGAAPPQGKKAGGSAVRKAATQSKGCKSGGGGGSGGGVEGGCGGLSSKTKSAFKMQVMVRFRPAATRSGPGPGGGGEGGNSSEEGGEAMFLPLHQRLQLERMGHDTALEQEVHARMTSSQKKRSDPSRGKTFEEQKGERDGEISAGGSAVLSLEVAEEKRASAETALLGDKHQSGDGGDKGGEDKGGGDKGDGEKGNGDTGEDDKGAGDDADQESQRPRQTFQAKIVHVEEKRVLVNLPGAGLRYFAFDAVLGHGSNPSGIASVKGTAKELSAQEQTYVTAAVPALEAFLNGFSACLFVYGQTGSGKTHTMFGGEGSLEALLASNQFRAEAEDGSAPAIVPEAGFMPREAGIVPRVLVDLMGVLKLMEGSVDATVTVNYLEIYNDQISDLISGAPVTLYRAGSGVGSSRLQDGLSGEGGSKELFTLSGASDTQVSSVQGILRALVEGETNKHKAATAMNERSSRAHTVFAISLTQRHKGYVKRSRLHLVDLGGSEQVKRSKAEGETLAEAIEINTSLMVLGKVIDALVLRKAHVPYYEAKLTMLLQPALGGTTRTTVLVTASPDGSDASETLHALRFGERCAQVESKALVSATASMADVLGALDKSIVECEASLQRLELAGGKAQAQADQEALAAGTGGGAGGFATKAAPAARAEGGYSLVEDAAGKYLLEKNRLAVLQHRKMEIVGGGRREGR